MALAPFYSGPSGSYAPLIIHNIGTITSSGGYSKPPLPPDDDPTQYKHCEKHDRYSLPNTECNDCKDESEWHNKYDSEFHRRSNGDWTSEEIGIDEPIGTVESVNIKDGTLQVMMKKYNKLKHGF